MEQDKNSEHKKRVAVCFSGQMRTLREANTKEYLLDQLRQLGATVDTFAIVSDCDDVAAVKELLGPVRVECKTSSRQQPFAACHGKAVAYQRMAVVNSTVRPIPAGLSAVNGYIEQLEGIHMCHQVMREHEEQQQFLYDLVVRTRFDLEWQDPFQIPPSDIAIASASSAGHASHPIFHDTGIFAPDHQQWGGLNDKFAVGARAAMSVYAGQIAGLVEYCALSNPEGGGGEGGEGEKSGGFVLQAETWLSKHLQQHSIVAHPVHLPVYILRATGKRSPT
jgi:hypothetical protein